MASSNSDDQNLGNETLESSSSSFRRGKKRNSDKNKKPLRGLGVAQLEKIRLHEMSSTYHHNPYFENFSQVSSAYYYYYYFHKFFMKKI